MTPDLKGIRERMETWRALAWESAAWTQQSREPIGVLLNRCEDALRSAADASADLVREVERLRKDLLLLAHYATDVGDMPEADYIAASQLVTRLRDEEYDAAIASESSAPSRDGSPK